MANPSRNDIYNAVIKHMVSQAIQAEEELFVEEHGADTDAQLVAYLQESSQRLVHTPWPKEIAGGTMIRERFGSWEAALESASLPVPSTPDAPSQFVRIQLEALRQKQVYRDKKAAKKQRAQERIKAQKGKLEEEIRCCILQHRSFRRTAEDDC